MGEPSQSLGGGHGLPERVAGGGAWSALGWSRSRPDGPLDVQQNEIGVIREKAKWLEECDGVRKRIDLEAVA